MFGYIQSVFHPRQPGSQQPYNPVSPFSTDSASSVSTDSSPVNVLRDSTDAKTQVVVKKEEFFCGKCHRVFRTEFNSIKHGFCFRGPQGMALYERSLHMQKIQGSSAKIPLSEFNLLKYVNDEGSQANLKEDLKRFGVPAMNDMTSVEFDAAIDRAYALKRENPEAFKKALEDAAHHERQPLSKNSFA